MLLPLGGHHASGFGHHGLRRIGRLHHDRPQLLFKEGNDPLLLGKSAVVTAVEKLRAKPRGTGRGIDGLHPSKGLLCSLNGEQFVRAAAQEQERLGTQPQGNIRKVVLLPHGGNHHGIVRCRRRLRLGPLERHPAQGHAGFDQRTGSGQQPRAVRAHGPAEAPDAGSVHIGKVGQKLRRGGIFGERLFGPDHSATGQAVVHRPLTLVNRLLHFFDAIGRFKAELHPAPLLRQRCTAPAPVQGIRHNHHVAQRGQFIGQKNAVESGVHPLPGRRLNMLRHQCQRLHQLLLADVETGAVVVHQHQRGAGSIGRSPVRNQKIGRHARLPCLILHQGAGVPVPVFGQQNGQRYEQTFEHLIQR